MSTTTRAKRNTASSKGVGNVQAGSKSRSKKSGSATKQPTLAQLNARLAATREARLKRAEENCLRITGKPRL
jgi:hypothetical protein